MGDPRTLKIAISSPRLFCIDICQGQYKNKTKILTVVFKKSVSRGLLLPLFGIAEEHYTGGSLFPIHSKVKLYWEEK